MEITATVGRIVRLKDYTTYAKRKEQYAGIVAIKNDIVELKWIKDAILFETEKDNIEILKWNNISTFYTKLKEGDIVLTNGDGLRATSWFLGKIGEKQPDKMYIWNNTKNGGTGIKDREAAYEYSWVITKESTGKIIILETEKIPANCFECGAKCDEDELTKGVDNNYYCEDCMEDKFTKCTHCEEYIFKADVVRNDSGDEYCSECYDKIFVHCLNCGYEIERNNALNAEGSYFCEDCWFERFKLCDLCGDTFRLDDLIYDEDTDKHYCGACHRKKVKKVIHDYGYTPKFNFSKLKWDEELYMGVELEVQRENEYAEFAGRFIKFLKEQGTDKYFYLKHDGTLRVNDDPHAEYQGFEVVTQPFTLQYAHKNLGFNKILQWLKENKFDYGDKTQRCGLHIHISRNFFEELDVTKLRIFFLQNKKEIFKFSKRKSIENEFCAYEKMDAISIAKGRGQEGNNHHTAIDAQTAKQTVEIRVFNSTLDTERFLAILQFVDAIAHFVKVVGITSLLIGEREYKNNSWRLFIDWAKAEGRYEDMIQQLHKEKLIKA